MKKMPIIEYIRGLPANTPLMSCHQDIQVSIFDPCGGLTAPIKLGKGYDVTTTKDTNNQYTGGTYVMIHK